MHSALRARGDAWRLAIVGVCLVVFSGGAALADGGIKPVVTATPVSPQAVRFAEWIVASGDNGGLGFLVVDKVAAQVAVFHADGRLRGVEPALLGMALGDDSAPGIGQRELASITADERTTPAGRFVASIGNDLGQKDIIWVDYESAVSLHRVFTGNPQEGRLQRLGTATAADNRISYGCINVSVSFYEAVVRPTFIGSNGIVYVLPEVRSLGEVFPAYAAQ